MYPVNTLLSAFLMGLGFSCGIAFFVYLVYLWETRNTKEVKPKINLPYEEASYPYVMEIKGDMKVHGKLEVEGSVFSNGSIYGMTNDSPSRDLEEDTKGL